MRLGFFLVILLIPLVGCNADPSCRRETALLRAEIMDLEDKYFLMKSQRDDALDSLINQGQADQARRIRRRNPSEVPRTSAPGARDIQPPGNRVWDETEIFEAPSGDGLPDTQRPGEFNQPNQPTRNLLPEEIKSIPATRSSARLNGKQVDEIVIDLVHSGLRRDPVSQANVLQILLQPLTADNEVVYDSGSLNVVVSEVNGAEAGEQLGRWDFLPEELDLFHQQTSPVGILLQLPLEGRATQQAELNVQVQFQGATGSQLQTTSILPVNRSLKRSPPIEIRHGDDDLLAIYDFDIDRSRASEIKPQPRVLATPANHSARPQWRPTR